jgi:PAS domain S-box-containing protein
LFRSWSTTDPAVEEFRPWIGPVISAATLALIILVRPAVPIATPGIVLLLTVAVSAVLSGTRSALVSAAIAVGFAAVDASSPAGTFAYTTDQLSRLLVTAVVAPAMGLMVGGIKAALDRASARAAAQRSEDRERALTDTANDAIVVIDESSTVLSANPATVSMFGYPVDELIGERLTRLMPERLRDSHMTGIGRYLATGDRSISWSGIELTGRDASGREFPVEVSMGEYRDGGERRITGIIRDISHRKELEAQLLQAQKMEAIGQLAGGVAHDFNNSLLVIGGFADLLEQDLADTPHAQPIAAIRRSAEQAASLTRQLLAFGRRQDLQPDVIDVNRALERVEPMLRRLIGEHISLVVRPGGDLWPVYADPAQLETVLINLAVNARDAMPTGGMLTIESANAQLDNEYAREHVEVVPGPYVMLAVSDSGRGIDRDILPRIFEPFFTTKEIGSGTGLGLASVHGIVRQSGGHIWVYSEAGRGTTFKVYLPRAVGTSPLTEQVASSTPEHERSASILVAEDEPGVRALLITILERNGYRVLTTANGTDALEVIRDGATQVDLVITDVVMPGLSGPEVAAEVQALRPSVPVLFISGYTANALEDRGVPADHLLEKPFRPEELLRSVRSLIGTADGEARG